MNSQSELAAPAVAAKWDFFARFGREVHCSSRGPFGKGCLKKRHNQCLHARPILLSLEVSSHPGCISAQPCNTLFLHFTFATRQCTCMGLGASSVLTLSLCTWEAMKSHFKNYWGFASRWSPHSSWQKSATASNVADKEVLWSSRLSGFTCMTSARWEEKAS